MCWGLGLGVVMGVDGSEKPKPGGKRPGGKRMVGGLVGYGRRNVVHSLQAQDIFMRAKGANILMCRLII